MPISCATERMPEIRLPADWTSRSLTTFTTQTISTSEEAEKEEEEEEKEDEDPAEEAKEQGVKVDTTTTPQKDPSSWVSFNLPTNSTPSTMMVGNTTPAATGAVVAILPPLEYGAYSSLGAAALKTTTLGQGSNAHNGNQVGVVGLGSKMTTTTTSEASVHPLQSMPLEGDGGVSSTASMMLLSIDSRQRPLSSMEYAEGINNTAPKKQNVRGDYTTRRSCNSQLRLIYV
jgi:hypothetical protein